MGFSTPLDVRRLGGDKWEVLAQFTYYLDNDALERVDVHKGFVTDFASVPFPFSRIFPPVGKSYDLPSVLHDFLYWLPYVWNDSEAQGQCRKIERVEADRIYLQAMLKQGTPFLVRRAIYAGVRVGGWYSWQKYRLENII